MRFVHDHPELGHEEFRCAGRIASELEAGGYTVELGLAGMETAFRARLDGSRPGRTVGLTAVYDAVPAVRPDGSVEAIHACGHGPISGGVVAAALALADLRERLAGSVQVLGCPADEIHSPGAVQRGGGKAISAEAGVWNGIDAALYAHPEFINTVSQQSLFMRRDRATISGTRSLQPGAVQPPLDAAGVAVRAARNCGRSEVMLERMVVDGDVEEATGLVTVATFLLFAETAERIDELAAGLREELPDAGWRTGHLVYGVRPDAEVTARVGEAFAAAGRDFVAEPPPLPFATDFGNISQRIPAALIGIGHEGGWEFHTDEGARQFASRAGEDAALALASVLALAAIRLTDG